MRVIVSGIFSLTLGMTTAPAATDARFGLVGTGGKAFAEKFGLTYYALEGNYSAAGVFSSTLPSNDPTGGRKVLRKVAKLNVRVDSLGQSNAQFETALGGFASALAVWHSTRTGPKPTFAWYNPSATAISAAESLQIVTTIQREKILSPVVTGTVWEIGNEPNLFPAILPASYAAIFNRYYKIIKQVDPSAKVALGPVFVRETGMDLIPHMQEIITQSLVAKGLGQPGQPLFDSVNKDVWIAYSSRTLSIGTIDYFGQVLAALDTSVHPEIASLHIYPYEDRLPVLSQESVKHILDSLADSLSARMQKKNPAAVVWVTEFGNIKDGFTEEQAAAQASFLIDVFTANARIQNWFYYKATGYDTQLLGLPGTSTAPLTRLAADSSFNPADGNFACGRLNMIGLMYYLRANGTACTDPLAGFSVSNSSALGTITQLRVRLGQAGKDTVRMDVARSGGTILEGQYTITPGALVFAPGDTSKVVTVQTTANFFGTRTLVLKLGNLKNALPSADSTHTISFSIGDAILPGIPGSDLSFDAAQARIRFHSPKETNLTVLILNASGQSLGSLHKQISAGHNSINLRDGFKNGSLPAGLYKVEVSGPGFRQVFNLPWLNL